MLEIIAILILAERISTKARLKGYIKTGRFILLFIFMWYLFEFIGGITGSLIGMNNILLWFFSFLFSLAGAYIAFLIVGMLKAKEILTAYDPDVKIDTPFEVNLFSENLVVLAGVGIIIGILMYFATYYFIILLIIVLLFTKYGIYKIVFQQDGISVRYLYGKKYTIEKKQVVRALVNNKLYIEIHWKKSPKHSTRTLKFSSNSFLMKKISVENISRFLEKPADSDESITV